MRWMLLSKDMDCGRWPAPVRNATRTSADAPGFAMRRIQGMAPSLRPLWRCGSTLLLSVRRRRRAGARAVRTQENTSELYYLYQKEQHVTRKNGFLDPPKGACDGISGWRPPRRWAPNTRSSSPSTATASSRGGAMSIPVAQRQSQPRWIGETLRQSPFCRREPAEGIWPSQERAIPVAGEVPSTGSRQALHCATLHSG